eukprot:COSAG01_NODE_22735_length_843_cov_1.696237_2_plen_177_part_01
MSSPSTKKPRINSPRRSPRSSLGTAAVPIPDYLGRGSSRTTTIDSGDKSVTFSPEPSSTCPGLGGTLSRAAHSSPRASRPLRSALKASVRSSRSPSATGRPRAGTGTAGPPPASSPDAGSKPTSEPFGTSAAVTTGSPFTVSPAARAAAPSGVEPVGATRSTQMEEEGENTYIDMDT